MRYFKVDKKTGFVCKDDKVKIYDSRKMPFYFKKNHSGFICFNLPRGSYYTDNAIKAIASPVVYSLPEIPKPENLRPLPKRPIRTVYRKNPNKCTVLLFGGKFGGESFSGPTIIFDLKYRKYPIAFIRFIKKHEYSHYLYSGNGDISEQKCDTLARRLMLIDGYNPSQLDIITRLTLSDRAQCRKRLSYEQTKIANDHKHF